MGLRGIERVTEIHHTTVMNWIKEAGIKLPDARLRRRNSRNNRDRRIICGAVSFRKNIYRKQEEQGVDLDSGKSLATWNTIMDSWRSQQYKFSDYLVNYQMLA